MQRPLSLCESSCSARARFYCSRPALTCASSTSLPPSHSSPLLPPLSSTSLTSPTPARPQPLDPPPPHHPAPKVYYDILAERSKRGLTDVAICRLEHAHPTPPSPFLPHMSCPTPPPPRISEVSQFHEQMSPFPHDDHIQHLPPSPPPYDHISQFPHNLPPPPPRTDLAVPPRPHPARRQEVSQRPSRLVPRGGKSLIPPILPIFDTPFLPYMNYSGFFF